MELPVKNARGLLHLFDLAYRRSIIRIREKGDPCSRGHKLAYELKLFCLYCLSEQVHACNVATWPIEAGDEARRNHVAAASEHERNGRSRRLNGLRCGGSPREDYSHLCVNQFGRERRQTTVLSVCIVTF